MSASKNGKIAGRVVRVTTMKVMVEIVITRKFLEILGSTTYLAGCSEKIGGPNKIDESKFGQRKYHKGHPVTG
jgi:hypothetical protein